jgi:protein-S-isoprenylcysteine O-methyltransferase Ste14
MTDTETDTDRPSAIPWPPLLLIAAIGGSVALGRWLPLPWPGQGDTVATAIGLGLGCIGLLLMAWSFWEFQKAKANILPHKAATTLITTGPFARFRNPIYLADTLILLGLAEISRNIWFAVGALLFVILVTLLAIIPEERHLARKFGAEYEAYKARSRRWI